jgi:hypothetical protein
LFGNGDYKHEVLVAKQFGVTFRVDPSLSGIRQFVTSGSVNAYAKMGQVPGVGAALALVLVVGLILLWSGSAEVALRRRIAAPTALLVGAFLFLAVSGYGRSAFGVDYAHESRYVHLVAAMSLPAIAVAADALARRWRFLTPVVLVLLVVGIPGNLAAVDPTGNQVFTLGDRNGLLRLASSPFMHRVPRSVHPIPVTAYDVTVGWLLDGIAAGRIPPGRPLSPVDDATLMLRLVLVPSAPVGSWTHCALVQKPRRLALPKNGSIGIRDGSIDAVYLAGAGVRSTPVAYVAAPGALGGTLLTTSVALDLQVSPSRSSAPPLLCTSVRRTGS